MRRQVVAADVHVRLIGDLEEISRMVSGLIRGLERRGLRQPPGSIAEGKGASAS